MFDPAAASDPLISQNLFAQLPEELAGRYDPQRPWTLLGEVLEELFALLPHRAIGGPLAPGVHLLGDGIVIAAGATVGPGAVIQGPAYIGRGVEIRPGAYLRGGVWIGDGAVVGANTEVKRAILLSGARASHLNFVGDSILGRGVNLGAGTILANLRHDADEVRVPHDGEKLSTGRQYFGAILGDGVRTGCNCVLHPGVVIGPGTHLYPGVHLRAGVYPAGRLVKLRQEHVVVERWKDGEGSGSV